MLRQPVRSSNGSSKRVLQGGQRNGEQGKVRGSGETETERNLDKMLALRVRWRE